MRPHLRPSAIWMSLVVVAAVIGVARLGHDETAGTSIATPSEPPTSTFPGASVEPAATSLPPVAAAPFDARSSSALASAPETTQPGPNEPPIPAGEMGMVVGIDPETGRIGKPSAELRARLETMLPDPALDRSMEGIEIIHKPDGSMMADLKGRFADYTVVRITPDGRKIESCIQGPQVEDALQGAHAHDAPAPPAPKHEVR